VRVFEGVHQGVVEKGEIYRAGSVQGYLRLQACKIQEPFKKLTKKQQILLLHTVKECRDRMPGRTAETSLTSL
jgi:hypothetical protein